MKGETVNHWMDGRHVLESVSSACASSDQTKGRADEEAAGTTARSEGGEQKRGRTSQVETRRSEATAGRAGEGATEPNGQRGLRFF